MVQGVEFTVNHGAGYQTVYSNPFVVNAEFYFSDSGDEDALWELAPGEHGTSRLLCNSAKMLEQNICEQATQLRQL